MYRLVLVIFFITCSSVQADFGAVILAPSNMKPVALSSFSWKIPITEPGLPERASLVGDFPLKLGRTAPDQGPAMLVIAKPVIISITGLSEYCGTDQLLSEVHIDIPVWDSLLPTDERYYQHFILGQVSLKSCQHAEGARADVLWLDFETITRKGEPLPLNY